MTLTRFLIIVFVLVGSTLAFLSFAPPQTGKWVYMWQVYTLNKYGRSGTFYNDWYSRRIDPPNDFTGLWVTWDNHGNIDQKTEFEAGVRNGKSILIQNVKGRYEECHRNYFNGKLIGLSKNYVNGTLTQIWDHQDGSGTDKITKIYNIWDKVDRRAEFGIPIE